MTDPRREPSPGAGPLDPRKLLREAVAGGAAAAAAAAWQPPEVAALAAQFPELDVVELVGRGGMGAVYRAVQKKLGRPVALKVLPRELAADPAFEERFLREARALAALQHPRIVTLFDYGERDGLYYLVTEFVDGLNLRQLMNMGELSPAEALRLAPQICEALQYAHDRGVVHRDVKPENLLVNAAGELKIADFGLARVLGDAPATPTLTRSSQVLGTPHYMAPEQWRHGEPVDHRADIYAVGVVLYEMLTGELPLGHFEPPSRRPGVSRGLDQVVQRALAQRPEQRYQRASEVGDALRREAQQAPPSASQRRRRSARDGTPGPASALRAAWILLLLAIAGNFAVVYWQQRQAHAVAVERAESTRLGAEARAWAARSGAPLDGDVVAHYVEEVLRPQWEQRRAEALAAGRSFDEPEPSYVRPSFAAPDGGRQGAFGVRFLIVPPMLLAAFLFSFFGFVAVARIRARRAGTGGLGLALVTAWGLPLAGFVVIPSVTLAQNLRDPDTSVLAGAITAAVLLACGGWWLVSRYRRIAAEVAREPA